MFQMLWGVKVVLYHFAFKQIVQIAHSIDSDLITQQGGRLKASHKGSPSTTSLCRPHTTSQKINRAISEYTSDKLILSRAISTSVDFNSSSNADRLVWSDSGLDPAQLIAFILLDIIYGWYWSLYTSLENCYERNDMIMWQGIKSLIM